MYLPFLDVVMRENCTGSAAIKRQSAPTGALSQPRRTAAVVAGALHLNGVRWAICVTANSIILFCCGNSRVSHRECSVGSSAAPLIVACIFSARAFRMLLPMWASTGPAGCVPKQMKTAGRSSPIFPISRFVRHGRQIVNEANRDEVADHVLATRELPLLSQGSLKASSAIG
jgi:hypothetical protein